MFTELRNTPRDYAWGAPGAITGLLGVDGACAPAAEGSPEAELWLGAHHGAPSEVPAAGLRLDAWIAQNPERALGPVAGGLRPGAAGTLPFLAKVLAAGAPLSLQTHPSLELAEAGFAREEAAGVPLAARTRNYRDRLHKPELLLAVSERFSALVGFRDAAEAAADVRALADAAPAARDGEREAAARLARLAERLAEIAAMPPSEAAAARRALVGELLGDRRDPAMVDAAADAARALRAAGAEPAAAAATAIELAERYPGDPGVLIALLLNRVELAAGEAVFLGPGTLHAYLSGVGVEVMAASDNVLRGGLTGKHVDVPELLATLDAATLAEPRLAPRELAPGVRAFAPGLPDFRVLAVESDAELPIDGPAILLAIDGDWSARGAASATELPAGAACFATPDERELSLRGRGRLVVATTDLERRPA